MFTPEAETFILDRANRMQRSDSLVHGSVVLLNVLKVDTKDKFGKVVRTKGSYVYVGLIEPANDLESAILPNCGKQILLNGFQNERDFTVCLSEDLGSDTHLYIRRH